MGDYEIVELRRDRFSELPRSLIFQILSFLEMRDVVSTSLLSKGWNNLWTTTPYLNFRNSKNLDPDEARNFVNPALLMWKGTKILKFEIVRGCNSDLSSARDLDSWICFAVEKKVEELNVHWWGEGPDVFTTPQCLSSCSSLRKLSLEGGSPLIHGSPAWNQIKSLKIHDSSVSEVLINQILLGSPQLDDFDLCILESNENLTISSTNLKKLKIDKYIFYKEDGLSPDTTLKICCPNLETLEISGVLYSKCLILNVSSLTDATLGFNELSYKVEPGEAENELLGETLRQILPSIQHIEKVALSCWCIEVFGASLKKHLLSPLLNVKFLKLNVDGRFKLGDIVNVLGIFPNLQKLIVEDQYLDKTPFVDDPLGIETNLSFLEFETSLSKSFLLQPKIIEVTSFMCYTSIYRLMGFLLKHALVLENLVIPAKNCLSFERDHTCTQTYFSKVEKVVVNMPRSSPTAKVIFKNLQVKTILFWEIRITRIQEGAERAMSSRIRVSHPGLSSGVIRGSMGDYERGELGRDRLSELPLSLIFYILSFLGMRDVVSTSLLSKGWNNLWTTIPYLNFRNISKSYNPERFRNFVNRALIFWKGTTILKFEIDIGFNCDISLASDFDLWTRFAVENKVEELNLHLREEGIYGYKTPHCLISCSSLRKLSLVGCCLRIRGSPTWYQLKSLQIHDTCFSDFCISEELINQILLGTPHLDDLDLYFRENNENLNIQSTSLKKLMIDKFLSCDDDDNEDEPSFDTVLKICCPNVETLEISGVPYSKCLLTDVSSLTDATLWFDELSYDVMPREAGKELFGETLRQILPSIQHSEKITLSFWCVEVLGVSLKKHLLPPLPNVKFLKLYVHGRTELGYIINVLGIFPNLKMLVIEDRSFCETGFVNDPSEFNAEKFLKFETNLSESFLLQLKTIEVTSYMCYSSICRLIGLLLKHAYMLENLVIWAKKLMSCEYHPCPQTYFCKVEKIVLNMPRSSPTAKVIFKTSLK